MMRRVPPRGAGPTAQLDQCLNAYYRGLSDGRLRRLGVGKCAELRGRCPKMKLCDQDTKLLDGLLTHGTVRYKSNIRTFPFIDRRGKFFDLSVPDAIPSILHNKKFEAMSQAYSKLPKRAAEGWYLKYFGLDLFDEIVGKQATDRAAPSVDYAPPEAATQTATEAVPAVEALAKDAFAPDMKPKRPRSFQPGRAQRHQHNQAPREAARDRPAKVFGDRAGAPAPDPVASEASAAMKHELERVGAGLVVPRGAEEEGFQLAVEKA